MEILIAGYPGYIATILQRHLSQLHDVRCIGRSIDPQKKNCFKVDLLELTEVKEAIRPFSPDWIINAANTKNLYEPMTGNSDVTSEAAISSNILEQITLYSPNTKYLHISSRHEYGVPTRLPVGEDTPISPQSDYGQMKANASRQVIELAHQHHLTAVILRLSNVFGWPDEAISPHFSSASAINSMIYTASLGQDLQVFRPGDQFRDYLYLTDFQELIARVLEGTVSGAVDFFNVGSGIGISMKNMATIIAEQAGVRVQMCDWPAEAKMLETGSYVSDISHAHRTYGWQPKLKFKEVMPLLLHANS